MGEWAVLLTCHGTVDRAEDIPAFVAAIRRGRPASAEIIAEVTRRFEHIGKSPLMRISAQQADVLARRLGVAVRVAGRLWHPYPREVMTELAAGGVTGVVSLPLAPQSAHVYNRVVEEAALELGMECKSAPSWGTRPELVDAFTEAIVETAARFDGIPRTRVAVVLTAHSLPVSVIAAGDPYERDFRAMADAVTRSVARRGLAEHPVRVAFQSQGMDGGEWLGPDLSSCFAELAGEGALALLVAPIGFVADHTETLYDIDVEAAALAGALGFRRFERMAAMNVRPRFVDALEAVARSLLPTE